VVEALNMAAIWKLPVVFVCENNQYAMSLHYKKAFAIERISDRAASYGMPGVTVDGNDVHAVYQAVRDAAERARGGEGLTLIENLTYRWRGHSRSDANRYRTKEEIEAWKEKCPIKRFKTLLIEVEIVDPRTLKPLDEETIIQSVIKTGRALVVQEACKTGGYGGELVAVIAGSEAFNYLEAPVKRLAGRDIPVPYNRILEYNTVPQVENIVEASKEIVMGGM
jgi:TPP-dependent pyruvate/acetoin dehydrogenase alpha subunit